MRKPPIAVNSINDAIKVLANIPRLVFDLSNAIIFFML